MHSRKAFTLIESLLSLVIFIISLSLFNQNLKLLKFFDNQSLIRQNFLGLIELRRVLSLGKSMVVNNDEICMDYQADETCFYYSYQKLIQTPGTVIYMIGLDDLQFSSINKNVFIHYLIDEIEYNYWIGWIK